MWTILTQALNEKATLSITWLLSGRQDSNLRPLAPKASALAGLRYAPIKTYQARRV